MSARSESVYIIIKIYSINSLAPTCSKNIQRKQLTLCKIILILEPLRLSPFKALTIIKARYRAMTGVAHPPTSQKTFFASQPTYFSLFSSGKFIKHLLKDILRMTCFACQPFLARFINTYSGQKHQAVHPSPTPTFCTFFHPIPH